MDNSKLTEAEEKELEIFFSPELNVKPSCPRDFLELIENNTTFGYAIADGGNMGGNLNNNDDYMVWIVQDEETDPYWIYVDYHGEEAGDHSDLELFDVEVETMDDVLETLAYLESLIPLL